MRAVWGYILSRSLRETGDTTAGFAYLRRLDGQNKEYVQNPALVSEKIARQEGARHRLGPTRCVDQPASRHAGRLRLPAQRNGRDRRRDRGDTGQQASGCRAGVRRIPGTPRCSSRRLARFTGSRRGLDLPVDSLPDWVREVRRQMVVADVDWNLLAERGPEWMRWWDQQRARHRAREVSGFLEVSAIKKQWAPHRHGGADHAGHRARRDRGRLLGPSGSGKTTMLRLLAGFEVPAAAASWSRARTSPPCRRRGAASAWCSSTLPCFPISTWGTTSPSAFAANRCRAQDGRGAAARGPCRVRAAQSAGVVGRPAAARGPWRAPWRRNRACSCSTSRSRTSTGAARADPP